MIETILDAIDLVLKEQGEPESPYWLASQMVEMRVWRASEHDVRAALKKDIRDRGDSSLFVEVADDEWALRFWDTENSNAVGRPKM